MFDSGISVKNLVDELKNTEVDIALEIPNKTYVSWLNSLQQTLYTEIIKEQKKMTLKNEIVCNKPYVLVTGKVSDFFFAPSWQDVLNGGDYSVTYYEFTSSMGSYVKQLAPAGAGNEACDVFNLDGTYVGMFAANNITGAPLDALHGFNGDMDAEVSFVITLWAQEKAEITGVSIASPISPSLIKVNDGESTPRFEDIFAVYADDTQLIKSSVTSGVIFPDTFYKDNNNIGYHTKEEPEELTIVYMTKPALVTVTEDDEINDANVMVPVEFIDLVKAKLRGEAYKLANEGDISAMWLNDYNILLETFKVWIATKAHNFGL